MGTPGHRAGPTADDGGLDPATGGHPGNGLPDGDADSGLPPHRTRPDAGTRDALDRARPVPRTRDPRRGLPADPTRPGAGTPDPGYGLPQDQAPPGAGTRNLSHGPPPHQTRTGTGTRAGDGYGRPADPARPGAGAGTRDPGQGRPPDRMRPGAGTRGSGYGPPQERPRPEAGTRRTGTQPGNPGRTRPRPAAPSGRDELRTAAEINARIARTIENARSARAGRAAPPRPSPGPGGYAPARPGRPDGQGRADQDRPAGAPAAAGPSLLRSSGAMAVGTLASRITGFVRNAILLYALGTHDLGNAYNVANTLPNIVYNLALGGILTSVVVPLLVKAAKRDRDRGEAYDQRIFTLGVLALGGITVVATAASVPIASI